MGLVSRSPRLSRMSTPVMRARMSIPRTTSDSAIPRMLAAARVAAVALKARTGPSIVPDRFLSSMAPPQAIALRQALVRFSAGHGFVTYVSASAKVPQAALAATFRITRPGRGAGGGDRRHEPLRRQPGPGGSLMRPFSAGHRRAAGRAATLAGRGDCRTRKD